MSVFQLNALLVLAGEDITGPLGQSSARWQIIGRVAFQGQTVAQLAREIGHARQSVQRVADRLERDGLVAYRPHPSDARTQLVEITPAGSQVLEQIYLKQLAWSEGILEQLDAPELERTVQSLDHISTLLKAGMETPNANNERRTS